MQISHVEKVTDQKHLNLYTVYYKDRGNADKKWIFASRSELVQGSCEVGKKPADAVIVVPFHVQQEKLVVIKEFRVVLGGWQYGFPAGLVDDGESIEAAGKRELFEETGLEMVRILSQSPAVYSSSGMTDESVSLLYVECRGIPSREFNESSEDIEVILLSREDAKNLLNRSGIKFDVKTWIVLSTFVSHGII